jgi:PAS domain S-box-containing protein
MILKDDRFCDEAELRKRAEEIARDDAALSREDIEALSPEETRRIVHELQVHQIELMMQNVELCRARQELEASQARYVDLYDFAPVGYITVSESGQIREANLTAARLLRVPRGTMLKQSISHFILSEDQEIYYRHRRQIFNTGESPVFELRLLRKDRSPFWAWLKATVVKDTDGTLVSRLVLSDITERKHTEEALQESEARYKRIVETANEGIMIMDRQFRYAFLNQKLADMLGYLPEEIIGQPVNAFIFEEDLPDHMANMQKRASGVGGQYERRHRRKDGSCCWTIVSATVLKDEAGQFAGSFAMLTDITKRKNAEGVLLETNRRLEDFIARANELKVRAEMASIAKSEFLANMSHEIRTPMNAIIGMTGFLLDENLTAEQKEYANIIRSSSEGLLVIINNILDISKIEANKIELDRQPLDIQRCIEGALDLVASAAYEKGLKTSCLIEESTPKVIMADPTRLRQILVNLLNNAVKFTSKGEVKVSVSGKKLPENGYEIHFKVNDTGIGIPEEKRNRLFQSFSQLDASTARKYGGTGLGLAISKRLVELMDGKIWVESDGSLGSTFHFTIQVEPTIRKPIDVASKMFGSLDPAHYAKLDLHIMLAEDNTVNQMVTLKMLNRLGCKADVVANGIEVLQALERKTYDVILMDVQMPEMDGLEATREIRRRWPKGPKIIAMTASALVGDKEMCIDAGMDGYISKPTTIEELNSALQSCWQEC